MFEVSNTRATVYRCPPDILQALDDALRYPTESAEALQNGFIPPGGTHGGWDGWKRLLRRPRASAPWLPAGLLSKAVEVVRAEGFGVQVDDKRVRPIEGVPDLFDPIELFPYQVEAADAAIKAGMGVLDMPPRAGKTRTMLEIYRRLSLPSIWITPTDAIASQTVEVIDSFFGEGHAHRQTGTKDLRRARSAQVIVCTAQTAVKLPEEIWERLEVLIVDEFHRAASKTYRDISEKAHRTFHRFGMTGTFLRSGNDGLEMLGVLSDVVYKITTAELVELGRLIPTHVAFIPHSAGPKPRGKDWSTLASKGLYDNEHRNSLAAGVAGMLADKGRKVVMLVGTKVQGAKLAKMVEQLVGRGRTDARYRAVEFISTDRKRDVQKSVIKAFNEGADVRVLIGTSLLGEGVDLPVADALVWCRGGKAEVTLIQGAFRVATQHPGKTDAILVDFGDRTHNRLMEHSLERLRIFSEWDLFTIDVLPEVRGFDGWLVDISGP